MSGSQSYTPKQTRQPDGWSNFQTWTQKWNRFFATLFCVLAFSLLFAIVVVNVINAERQIDKNDSDETTIVYNEIMKPVRKEEFLQDLQFTPGCFAESNCSFFCQYLNCSTVRSELNVLLNEQRCTAYELRLRKIDFTHDKLDSEEICVRYGVRNLTISNSNLALLLDGAFNDSDYRIIERLVLEHLSLWHISKNAFRGLDHLQVLSIASCPLSVVENEVMVPVSRSLKFFTMEAIKSPLGLSYPPFVFTGNASMLTLEQIEFCKNNFNDSLDASTFGDLKVLKNLYMTNNKLTALAPNIFERLGNTNSIRVLDLSDNLLTKLPVGVFRTFKPTNIKIYLDNNPWHCDSELEEMQQLMNHHSFGGMFTNTEPICQSPEHVKGSLVRDVDLNAIPTMIDTYESTTAIILSTDTEVVSTESTTSADITRSISPTHPTPSDDCPIINKEEVCIEDSYVLGCIGDEEEIDRSSQMNASFLVRVASFRIQLKELESNVVEIRVRNPSELPYFVIWFRSDTGQVGTVSNEEVTVKCHSPENDDYYVQQLTEDALYIFCVLTQGVSEGSPFDCLPITTRGLATRPGKEIWLAKDDQLVAYTLTLLCFVMCCLIGAITMYLIIRRIPTLLKGANGVVIVKESDVMKINKKKKDSTMSIMSFNSSSIESIQARPLPIPEVSAYLTPTPAQHKNAIYNTLSTELTARRQSDTSIESYQSYLSTIRPESSLCEGQKINCLLDLPNIPPPPIPPHPTRIDTSMTYKPDYTKIIKTPDVEKSEYEIYAICDYVKSPHLDRMIEN